MMFQHDLNFWFAVAGAAVVKMLTAVFGTDPDRDWRAVAIRAAVSAVVGIYIALIFTHPTLAHYSLDEEIYKIPVAASLTIIGESVMRLVLALIPQDWRGVVEIWKTWRGGGK
jgi:hypothetical protein